MEILLRKETIKQYDIKKCKENIEDIIREYIKIRYQYLNVQLLGEDYYNSSTTSNYELRPEERTIKYSDRVGEGACFKIDNENEAKELGISIANLYTKFTKEEKDFFDIVLLAGKAQRVVEELYQTTKVGLDPIRCSCIVKTAMHFNVSVLR